MVTNIEYAFQFRANRSASVTSFKLPDYPTRDSIVELLDRSGFVAVRYNPHSIADDYIVKEAIHLKCPVYMVGQYDDRIGTHWIRFCDGKGKVLVFLRTPDNTNDNFIADITNNNELVEQYGYDNYKEFRRDCESIVRLVFEL